MSIVTADTSRCLTADCKCVIVASIRKIVAGHHDVSSLKIPHDLFVCVGDINGSPQHRIRHVALVNRADEAECRVDKRSEKVISAGGFNIVPTLIIGTGGGSKGYSRGISYLASRVGIHVEVQDRAFAGIRCSNGVTVGSVCSARGLTNIPQTERQRKRRNRSNNNCHERYDYQSAKYFS